MVSLGIYALCVRQLSALAAKTSLLQPAQSIFASAENQGCAATAWCEQQPMPRCLRAPRVGKPPAEQAANRRCYATGQA